MVTYSSRFIFLKVSMIVGKNYSYHSATTAATVEAPKAPISSPTQNLRKLQ